MLTLRIEFLTGRYVAASFDDRDVPEWPPHPSRVFAALAAALAEGGDDREERAALEWLEQQRPPALAVGEHFPRWGHESFVPVNDTADPAKGLPSGEGFPLGRIRQRRGFASGTVEPPVAHLIWEDAEASEETRHALSRLAARVSYLGHSSSLVSLRIVQEPPPPTLIPTSDVEAEMILRVPGPGQLGMVEQAHRVYVETGNRGLLLSEFRGYRSPGRWDGRPDVPRSVFGEMVILRRVEGPRLPITATEGLAQILRRALMDAHPDPVPEILSGHRSDGSPSERPHVAFVALPDVGHPYAAGHIMGVGVVLPRSMTATERVSILKALATVRELTLGRAGVLRLERALGSDLQRGLRSDTWTRPPSTRWATVTPIELDIHPNGPYGEEAEASIARSCERIGLPLPALVLILPDSIVPGAAPWRAFRRVHRGRRPLVHGVIQFDTPVEGPILLGAARYRGLGLCRPVGGVRRAANEER